MVTLLKREIFENEIFVQECLCTYLNIRLCLMIFKNVYFFFLIKHLTLRLICQSFSKVVCECFHTPNRTTIFRRIYTSFGNADFPGTCVCLFMSANQPWPSICMQQLIQMYCSDAHRTKQHEVEVLWLKMSDKDKGWKAEVEFILTHFYASKNI